MTVIDLGSETHGYEESLFTLIERFKPQRVFAFDPLGPTDMASVRGVEIIRSASAAWTFDGELEFGIGAQELMNATALKEKRFSGEWQQVITVSCFDFSQFLTRFAEPVVVKMDIEGAEYDILDKMIADGTDRKVSFLMVEWHDHKCGDEPAYRDRRLDILDRLACPSESW